MENKSFIREITLSDLWRILLQRLWIMILAMVIVVVALVAYDKVTYVPKYNSTATLYILKQQNEMTNSQYGQQYEDFTLALKVVNDCNHLLKSHEVLDTVIENLGLEMSYSSLKGSISTNNPEDTRILEVTVTADTPENAKKIVDNVCDVGVAKVKEAMGFKQVNLYEYGVLNTSPCNRPSTMSYVIAGFAAMAVVYAIFFLTFLFDDRLKTDEEIERVLELTVIGDIPNADETKARKYGYYRYGSKYGYGKYAYGKYGYGYGERPKENGDSADQAPSVSVDQAPQKGKKAKNKKK